MKKTYPLWFACGALILYFMLYFLPGLIGIGYSLTDWNSFSDELNFVGLANFFNIFQDNTPYWSYIQNTLWFTVVTTLAKTVLGFCLALLFTRKIRFVNFQRLVIFMPQVLSFLIVGLVFRGLLHPSTGFINTSLDWLGLGVLKQDWLMSMQWAFNSVMAVDTWKGVGYIMVVFIAGLQSIPDYYHEAAIIDGASYFQRVRHIVIPMLIPALLVVTVLNITYGFRVFDIIYVLTNGGPGYATGVMNTAVFKEFSKGNFAMGTTLSTILFLFIALISYFIIKPLNAKTVEA